MAEARSSKLEAGLTGLGLGLGPSRSSTAAKSQTPVRFSTSRIGDATSDAKVQSGYFLNWSHKGTRVMCCVAAVACTPVGKVGLSTGQRGWLSCAKYQHEGMRLTLEAVFRYLGKYRMLRAPIFVHLPWQKWMVARTERRLFWPV